MASTVLPNGIIIPEKYSRDWYADLYHNWQELDNLLGGGTPKDGTLTIQKNGTTVQTFTANQSTNVTANIIVPTKTSDLTNDSGFITSDNTKIPLTGSNQISGSLIPATDNSIDIGSSTKNIKTLYTKGITIDRKTVDTDANGDMTYDGHIVDTIEEQGNGYIRYSNGIQICWGSVINNNNINTGESIYALPKAFNNSLYSLILTAQSNAVYYVSVMESSPGGTVCKTATQFGVFFCDSAMNLTRLPLGCNYIAIGTWK